MRNYLRHKASLLGFGLAIFAAGIVPHSASAATLSGWVVSFDIDAPVSEHVVLSFSTGDTLQAGAGSFMGYLIDPSSVSGTQGGNPITGLNPLAYLGNNNLFNPSSPYVDANGVSYEESDGNMYRLYVDAGTLKGDCTCDGTPVTTTVSNLQVPEPASMALLGGAMLGLAAIRRRR